MASSKIKLQKQTTLGKRSSQPGICLDETVAKIKPTDMLPLKCGNSNYSVGKGSDENMPGTDSSNTDIDDVQFIGAGAEPNTGDTQSSSGDAKGKQRPGLVKICLLKPRYTREQYEKMESIDHCYGLGYSFKISHSLATNQTDAVILYKESYDFNTDEEDNEDRPEHSVIYRYDGRDILGLSLRVTGELPMQIWKMITLSEQNHVILTHRSRQVHLLDSNFNILNTIDNESGDNGYVESGICLIGDDTFLLSEFSEKNGKTRFMEVKVCNNTFSTTHLADICIQLYDGLVAMFADGEHVVLADSRQSLCVVNIQSGECIRQIENYRLSIITSIQTDGQRILVGNNCGDIWLLDIGEEIGAVGERAVIKTGPDVVLDITFRGNKIVLTTTDCDFNGCIRIFA